MKSMEATYQFNRIVNDRNLIMAYSLHMLSIIAT